MDAVLLGIEKFFLKNLNVIGHELYAIPVDIKRESSCCLYATVEIGEK